MSSAILALTRPPCYRGTGISSLIKQATKGLDNGVGELEDRAVEILMDFLISGGWTSAEKLESIALDKNNTTKNVIEQCIDFIYRDMMKSWQENLPGSFRSPHWEVKLIHKEVVDEDSLVGIALYTTCPYVWKLPIHNIKDMEIRSMIVSMAEKANDLIGGVTSLNMSWFATYWGGGIMEEMKKIDEEGKLDLPMEKALEVDRHWGIVEEFMQFQYEDDMEAGWENIVEQYKEIKNTKLISEASSLEIENALSRVLMGHDASALQRAFGLLTSNHRGNSHNNKRLEFDDMDQEWFEDEMNVCDMAVSTIAYYCLDYDAVFDQDTQVEYENGAAFGGFITIEGAKAKAIRERLKQLSVGVTIMTLIECWVNDYGKLY